METEQLQKQPVSCPVCDAQQCTVKYEPWVDVSDPKLLYGAASGLPGTQRLVQCSNCQMIYETPRYSAEVILDGYASANNDGHDSQYPMRVESFYRALQSLHASLPAPGARVLDIGTAGGAFLDAAKRFGYEAIGLEPSHFLVAQGKQRGLAIEQGTIDQHPFPPASFDMICLWDVIEHLTQPKQALLAIKNMLKPDGILLINYPDIGTWQAKLAGRRFWWILSVHLHHFTRKTVTQICERSGFAPFHFQRYWQTLQFGYLEEMAIHYKIPFSPLLKKFTPNFVQHLPLPYYASQTTALAKVKP